VDFDDLDPVWDPIIDELIDAITTRIDVSRDEALDLLRTAHRADGVPGVMDFLSALPVESPQ